jgi:hypothetical protein
MDVPILFDGWQDEEGCEIDIGRLERMALPPQPHSEPPVIRVSGGTPGDDINWVINDLQWGDNVIWDTIHGVLVRLRADCVVKLLQHIEVQAVAARGQSPGSGIGHPRFYVVKKGDTLGSIAVKMYADRKKWKLIARANNIHDPKSIHVGQRLRIP